MTRVHEKIALAILAGLFFIFGLVSWVNAMLIPYFRIACELTHFQSYFVTFAFYIAYFVMAVPSGILLRRVGFKCGMMIGFFFMSAGALLFVPAAMLRMFEIFLIGLFSIGTGLAILQTAANPYVTILGPLDSAVRRISIMGICNKFAGILAPLVFAALMLQVGDKDLFAQIESGAFEGAEKIAVLNGIVRRVIVPYLILGVTLFIVGILIRYSVLPEINTDEENASSTNSDRKSIFCYPYLWLGALAIFAHVGTQIVAIDTIIAYAGSMGVSMADAKIFPSATLTLTLIGYIIGIIVIPKFVSQTKMLIGCTILGLLLSFGVVLCSNEIMLCGHNLKVSILFLAGLGLPNSLIYAGIWPLAIKGLGRHTKTGSSLLIMGLCGNAIIPQVYGFIADSGGLQNAYWVLIPCFIYLIFFSIKGHKIGADNQYT